MGDLSGHFSLVEFQCPDCHVGKPSPHLLSILEGARVLYGRPLIITSGYRCKKHNAEVGGVEPSEHGNYQTQTTDAADIAAISADDRYELVKIFLGFGVPRLGIGNYHLHVGVSPVLPQPAIFPDVEQA